MVGNVYSLKHNNKLIVCAINYICKCQRNQFKFIANCTPTHKCAQTRRKNSSPVCVSLRKHKVSDRLGCKD